MSSNDQRVSLGLATSVTATNYPAQQLVMSRANEPHAAGTTQHASNCSKPQQPIHHARYLLVHLSPTKVILTNLQTVILAFQQTSRQLLQKLFSFNYAFQQTSRMPKASHQRPPSLLSSPPRPSPLSPLPLPRPSPPPIHPLTPCHHRRC